MRFVTMADDGYVPGLAALLQSLVENAGVAHPHVTVVMTQPIAPEHRAALERIGCSLEYVRLADLGTVPPRPNTRRHRKVTLQKLLLFNLESSEPLLFVDSDMLCVGPLDGLDELPVLAAAPHRGWKLDRMPDGSPVFNSGLFTFLPDPTITRELLEFYAGSTEPFALGDQMVLNRFFREARPGAVQPLDESWNTLTWAFASDGRESLDGVRFLHYVGYKPWRNMLFAYDRFGAGIVELYDLWWGYFERSGVSSSVRAPRPARWLVRASHSTAAAPLWRLAHRVWFAYRRAVDAAHAPPRPSLAPAVTHKAA